MQKNPAFKAHADENFLKVNYAFDATMRKAER